MKVYQIHYSGLGNFLYMITQDNDLDDLLLVYDVQANKISEMIKLTEGKRN